MFTVNLSFLLSDHDHPVTILLKIRPTTVQDSSEERPRIILAVLHDSPNLVRRYDTVEIPFLLLGRFDRLGTVLEYIFERLRQLT